MRLLREAFRDLRANKVRSILATVSLCVAVLSLTAVATVGTVVNDIFVAEYEQHYGKLPLQQAEFDFGTLSRDRLNSIRSVLDTQLTQTGGYWTLFREGTSHVANAGPSDHSRVVEEISSVLVMGKLEQLRRLPVLSGKGIDVNSVYPGGLIANQAAAARFGGVGTNLSLTHLGQSPHANLTPYQQVITAVISDGVTQPRIYQSLNAASHYQPGVLVDAQLTLAVHFPGADRQTTHNKMHQVADLLGIDTDNRNVYTPGNIEATLGLLAQAQLGFGAVSGITLIVAVVGLLNIGLATLRERIRELSLRRALGATRRRIFALVMSSTLILSTVAATFTVAVAWFAVTEFVPRFMDPASALSPPGFPVQAAWQGVAAGLVAGLLGGAFPAVAASRVDMVQVLRE